MYLEPRVAESTTTTGTGDLTLAGALTGYRTINAAIGANRPFVYSIEAVDANGVPTTGGWEVGVGYLSSSTTLVRYRVLRSSNSDNAVNFITGTKYVYVIDAEMYLNMESDDFLSATLTTNGNISALAWGLSNSGTPTLAFQSGLTNHPGVLRITTGATSGNNARIHRGNNATGGSLIVPANLLAMRWVVRLPDITTMILRMGLGQDISAANFGTAGAWIEYDAASSANWRYALRQASTGTPINSTVAATSNTWYDLMMVLNSAASTAAFFANGNLLGTVSTNFPTTSLQAGLLIQTSAAAARSVDIDLHQAFYLPVARF